MESDKCPHHHDNNNDNDTNIPSCELMRVKSNVQENEEKWSYAIEFESSGYHLHIYSTSDPNIISYDSITLLNHLYANWTQNNLDKATMISLTMHVETNMNMYMFIDIINFLEPLLEYCERMSFENLNWSGLRQSQDVEISDDHAAFVNLMRVIEQCLRLKHFKFSHHVLPTYYWHLFCNSIYKIAHQIKSLDLSHNNLNNACVNSLGYILEDAPLEKLILSHNSLGDDFFNQWLIDTSPYAIHFRTCNMLDISNNRLDKVNHVAQWLRRFVSVKEINMACTLHKSHTFFLNIVPAISQWKSLRYINLKKNYLHSIDIIRLCITVGHRLLSLNISKNQCASKNLLDTLVQCHQLEHLNMSACGFYNDQGLYQAISCLKNLKSLCIDKNDNVLNVCQLLEHFFKKNLSYQMISLDVPQYATHECKSHLDHYYPNIMYIIRHNVLNAIKSIV